MKLEQLYMFMKVSEAGSVRGAGDALSTSPQNVSKEIMALERELGARLFERTNKGMTLTSQGRAAYVRINRVLEDIDDLNSYFRVRKLLSPGPAEPLKILTSACLEGYVRTLLNSLTAAYPEVLTYMAGYGQYDAHQQVQGLDPLTCDILFPAIFHHTMSALSPKISVNYDCNLLCSVPLYILVPASHPLSRLSSVNLNDLKDTPVCVYAKTHEDLEVWRKHLALAGVALDCLCSFYVPSPVNLPASSLPQCPCLIPGPGRLYKALPGMAYLPVQPAISLDFLMLINRNSWVSYPNYMEAFVREIDRSFDVTHITGLADAAAGSASEGGRGARWT